LAVITTDKEPISIDPSEAGIFKSPITITPMGDVNDFMPTVE
jgi:hypothetical protein